MPLRWRQARLHVEHKTLLQPMYIYMAEFHTAKTTNITYTHKDTHTHTRHTYTDTHTHTRHTYKTHRHRHTHTYKTHRHTGLLNILHLLLVIKSTSHNLATFNCGWAAHSKPRAVPPHPCSRSAHVVRPCQPRLPPDPHPALADYGKLQAWKKQRSATSATWMWCRETQQQTSTLHSSWRPT